MTFRAALVLVLPVILSGCGVVYSYVNNEDKLEDRLSVPMTKAEVLDTLGKPDKVVRDDGHILTWEYGLYSRYHWAKELAACPFGIIIGGCIFYPYVGIGAPEGNTSPHWVIFLDDQLCMWGNLDVVSTRETCKPSTSLSRTSETGTGQRGPSLEILVLPVLTPPPISTPIQRLAVIPLSDTTDPKVSSWLDLTLNFLRARHPQIVLVERETLGLALQEVQFQYRGRVADESMVRIGRLAGADTLLTYRLDALAEETIASVHRNGGQVLGSAEFRLLKVESGTTLFRQAVTASVKLEAPGSGKAWSEASVRQVHQAVMEDAVSYGLASLTMAYGDNPLGVVPDLSAAGKGVTILGVLQSGPAHVAGLKSKDRIVSLNGQPFTSWAVPITLPAALTIEREGKSQEVKVMISGR